MSVQPTEKWGTLSGNKPRRRADQADLFPDMLTDIACKTAKCPEDKPRARLTDAGGLYLEVSPSGSKRWFWKFQRDGKERRMALGSYPTVTLKQARSARDEARKVHATGKDPVTARQVARLTERTIAAATFETVSRDFHATKSPEWSGAHAARWLQRLVKDVFPWIGALPIADISAPMLLQVLRRVESRGVRETVHSIQQACGQVFRFGIASGLCERNPASDLRGALKPVLVKHMAAVLEPDGLQDMLRAMANYQGHPCTRTALMLSALLFQRPGNLRAMEWSELDLDAGMWTIPSAKMKRAWQGKVNGRPHLVPLAPQSVALLRELRPLTGSGRYVFPSMHGQGRPMSENTVNVALRRLGYDKETATAHGFRATARTIMVEHLNVNPEVIEAQLAHGKSGPLGSAYDRAEFMEERRRMMTGWARYLDELVGQPLDASEGGTRR